MPSTKVGSRIAEECSREGLGTSQKYSESASTMAASALAPVLPAPPDGATGSDVMLPPPPPHPTLLLEPRYTVILGKHQGIVTHGPGSDSVRRHLE